MGEKFFSWLWADSENEWETPPQKGGNSEVDRPYTEEARSGDVTWSTLNSQAKQNSPWGMVLGLSALVLCVEFLSFLILEASNSSDQKHFIIDRRRSADYDWKETVVFAVWLPEYQPQTCH